MIYEKEIKLFLFQKARKLPINIFVYCKKKYSLNIDCFTHVLLFLSAIVMPIRAVHC